MKGIWYLVGYYKILFLYPEIIQSREDSITHGKRDRLADTNSDG